METSIISSNIWYHKPNTIKQ